MATAALAVPPVPASRALLSAVLDPNSFTSWDEPIDISWHDPDYLHQLNRAAARAGTDEAVITGRGVVEGIPVAVVVGEFAFLGGSIGVAAAARIVATLRRATNEGLPVLAAPVSGGTRMQEGTVAFLQMARITQAVSAHRSAGLPYLVYLRDPTMGGVFASWGTLGHVTVAEPGALLGFLGPKVYRALHGENFPAGVQVAENLFRRGLVDAVVDQRHLGRLAANALRVFAATDGANTESSAAPPAPPAARPTWEAVLASRNPRRPGLRSLLLHAATDVLPLSGTGQGENDRAASIALARFGGMGAVVVGLDRRSQTTDAHLGPGALRLAERGMGLAEQLGLPLITVVDTPGAALSRAAEEGGLGGEIARCLARLLSLRTPTISVLLGQGTGGAALALTPADRVIAAVNGWLAPLPPEGASVIRYGDVAHAAEVATAQRIGAVDMLHDGVVDEVVDELPDAAVEPEAFCRRIGHALVRQLADLTDVPLGDLLDRRTTRYEHLGERS